MPATPVALLIRVVLLLLIAWALVRVLGRHSASLRALIWTLALGSALGLPLISRFMPTLEVSLLSPGEVQAPASPPAVDAPVMLEDAASPVGSVPIAPEPVTPANQAGGANLPSTPSPVSPAAILLGVWVVGVLLVLCRILLSHLVLFRITRQAGRLDDPRWLRLVAQVRRDLGIARDVRIRITGGVQVPAIAGVFRPVLLLPLESDGWCDAERRDVALHELAHVARWDALAQLVGQLACALYWFVPLAWLGARQAAALRERACDDVVLNAGIRASSYARSLLNLARVASGAELEPAALAMARTSRIEERVMGILDNTTRRERVTGRAAVIVFFLAAVVIGAVAAIEPVRRAVITPEEESRLSGEMVIEPVAVNEKPSIAPMPGSGRTAARQDTSLFCAGGVSSTSNSINQDDDERRWTVKVSGPSCKVEMRAEGRIEFNDDFTDIASISRNGFFKLDVTDRGTRRELDIRPNGGSLTRVYKLNGAEHEYDADARAWFGAFLIALDRTTAIAVDIRLPRLLRQGGTNAVLNETAQMPSDYARGVYYSALLKERRLTAAELTRLLDQAATLTDSDYYATELLKAVGRDAFRGDAERAAVMAMLRKMDSDYYRSEVMQSVFAAGQPSVQEMNVMLDVVNSMDSDYYKAEVLKHVLESGSLSAEQRAQVTRAAASMESAHYASEILKHMAARGSLTANERSAFFEALGRISDDYQRSEILRVLIRQGQLSQVEVEMVIKATQGMKSDFYRSEILGAMLTGGALREGDLVAVVTSLGNLDSDYYKDEILRKVLRNRGVNDRVRQAVIEATERMGAYHRDEVRRAAGAI